MNQQIKELAERALRSSMTHDGVYRPPGFENFVSKEFADKFAELIIRDVVDTVKRTQIVSPYFEWVILNNYDLEVKE